MRNRCYQRSSSLFFSVDRKKGKNEGVECEGVGKSPGNAIYRATALHTLNQKAVCSFSADVYKLNHEYSIFHSHISLHCDCLPRHILHFVAVGLTAWRGVVYANRPQVRREWDCGRKGELCVLVQILFQIGFTQRIFNFCLLFYENDKIMLLSVEYLNGFA